MTKKEHYEQLAVSIITESLKEEKNIQINKVRQNKKDPPDFYFEIGNDKIGCEVRNFTLIDESAKETDFNLEYEEAVKDEVIEKVKQILLQETDMPRFIWNPDFCVTPSTDTLKLAEKIVNAITTMRKESITRSEIYKRQNPEKYYRLFIEHGISRIEILYTEQLDGVNIDEKYHCGARNISTRPYKTIEAEKMQAVIDTKNKDIPKYKDNCDQTWLIITNYETIDFFILQGAAKEHEYKCNFDKVLYIQPRHIDPKISKQKGIGPLTSLYAVCELKTESRARLNN